MPSFFLDSEADTPKQPRPRCPTSRSHPRRQQCPRMPPPRPIRCSATLPQMRQRQAQALTLMLFRTTQMELVRLRTGASAAACPQAATRARLGRAPAPAGESATPPRHRAASALSWLLNHHRRRISSNSTCVYISETFSQCIPFEKSRGYGCSALYGQVRLSEPGSCDSRRLTRSCPVRRHRGGDEHNVARPVLLRRGSAKRVCADFHRICTGWLGRCRKTATQLSLTPTSSASRAMRFGNSVAASSPALTRRGAATAVPAAARVERTANTVSWESSGNLCRI
jgi:hypothetical protein